MTMRKYSAIIGAVKTETEETPWNRNARISERKKEKNIKMLE